MNEINKQVATATKWSFVTEIMAKLIVPLTNAVLARLLVPEAFGVVATINMVISFADVLTESGFGQFLIQHDFKSKKEFSQYVNVAFWSNFTVSSVIWLFVLLFAKPLSAAVGCPGKEIALVVACLSVPLTAFSSVPIAVLQKRYDYKGLFYNRIAASLTPLIVSTVFALLGFGYWSLIIGTLCSNCVKAIVLMLKAKWYPKFEYRFEALVKMLSFSIWILLEAIVMWACTWIDVFIIGRVFGEYYTGIYKTAQTTVTGILSVVTASVNSVVFVTLSKLKSDKVAFNDFFYGIQKKIAILVIPMGVGIFVFSDFITKLLLGSQWQEASSFLGVWGLCMALVATMGTFCREALRAKGMPAVSLLAQVCHLIFVVVVMLIVKNYGYFVFSYIRSAAYLQIIIMLFICVKWKLGLSPTIIMKNTFVPVIASIAMGLLGWKLRIALADNMFLEFVSIFMCIVVYFCLLSMVTFYRNYLISVGSGMIKKVMGVKK